MSTRKKILTFVRLERECAVEIEYPKKIANYNSTAVDDLAQYPSTWEQKGRRLVPISKIRENPYDGGRPRWNRPGFRDEVDSLVAQIESRKFFVAILVWKGERTYTVYDGHHRLRAAKELGWTKVPCVIVGECHR